MSCNCLLLALHSDAVSGFITINLPLHEGMTGSQFTH